MTIQLPRYTSKDYLVLAFIIVPYTLIMNTIIFGLKFYSGFNYFLAASFITGCCFSLFFTVCGGVAVLLKNRFPSAKQVAKRLTIMIFTFLCMSGLFLLLLFKLYVNVKYFSYKLNEDSFVWAYFAMGISNVFLTFLHEGIARYENWKKNHEETDRLKSAYQQSRLLGLKSQVNPHFLFNSLNSLSSLISEDQEEAEIFLDEMSKVYRYMLRNDEDNLVTLDTELRFLDSYSYLLQARYGNGLQFQVDVNESEKEKYLPPLTLQTIIENSFTQNMISKSSPLVIKIFVDDNDTLIICNNVQPKMIKENFDLENGIDNLVNKYQLLSLTAVSVEDSATERIIKLPLLTQKKEVLL
jgi:sensor histidine kinase YesM